MSRPKSYAASGIVRRWRSFVPFMSQYRLIQLAPDADPRGVLELEEIRSLVGAVSTWVPKGSQVAENGQWHLSTAPAWRLDNRHGLAISPFYSAAWDASDIDNADELNALFDQASAAMIHPGPSPPALVKRASVVMPGYYIWPALRRSREFAVIAKTLWPEIDWLNGMIAADLKNAVRPDRCARCGSQDGVSTMRHHLLAADATASVVASIVLVRFVCQSAACEANSLRLGHMTRRAMFAQDPIGTLKGRECAQCACLEPGDAETPFKQCGGCHAIYYCGVACRDQHWKKHRPVCVAIVAEQKAAKDAPKT